MRAVPKERAAPAFNGMISSWNLRGPEDVKTAQDFLFRYCVGKATEYGLPVKLHTGYYAGRNPMPLSRLRHNASDLCDILKDFPDTKFVLMHIGYPYQDEFIALAKHYRNAYIDMCWAWIINPAASVRFLKEFLVAAPANKLFTFGGDYIVAENVYGHSVLARRGIAQALSELVAEGWLKAEEVPQLADRLMRGNAREAFPQRGAPRHRRRARRNVRSSRTARFRRGCLPTAADQMVGVTPPSTRSAAPLVAEERGLAT